MLGFVLFLLIVLSFFGYIKIPQFPFLNLVLFHLNGRPVTVHNLLTFFVIMWLIGILPSPFRQIAMAILVIWILSVVGVLAIAGLSQIILFALVLGLVVYLFGGLG